MKPAYDKLGAEYKDSSSVLVADVDCTKEDKLCGDKGVQGYPTIKYYTAETGKDGSDFNSGRDYDSMKKFIEENLEVKCITTDPKDCSEKEVKFIEKMKAAGKEEVEKQEKRLTSMIGGSMKAELKKWVSQRLAILKQLVKEL